MVSCAFIIGKHRSPPSQAQPRGRLCTCSHHRLEIGWGRQAFVGAVAPMWHWRSDREKTNCSGKYAFINGKITSNISENIPLKITGRHVIAHKSNLRPIICICCAMSSPVLPWDIYNHEALMWIQRRTLDGSLWSSISHRRMIAAVLPSHFGTSCWAFLLLLFAPLVINDLLWP